MSTGTRERGIASSIAAAGVVLAVYLAALATLPLDVFWHPDEGAKYIGMRTLRWEGGLRYELPYPGRQFDPKYEFYPGKATIYPVPQRDGKVGFHWPIVFPLMTRPLFEAFGTAGIYIIPLACGWLSAVLAGFWAHLFVPRAAWLAILLTGVATPVAFYSLSFFEHTATTLFAGLALTLVVLRPGRTSTLLWIAPLLAVAIALRFETLAFVAAIIGAWGVSMVAQRWWEPRGLLRPRRSAWLLAALTIAALFALSFLLLETLPERHERTLRHLPMLADRMWYKRDFFLDSMVRMFLGEIRLNDYVAVRIWQIAAMLAVIGLIVGPFADTRKLEAAFVLPSLFIILQTSLLTVMSMLPFLQRQGVLAVAPFMGVALLALPEALRRRDSRLLVLATAGGLATVLGFLSLFATRIAQHDGSSLLGLDGAVRYMLWLYPIGAALAAIVLATYRESDAPPLARNLFAAMVAGLMLVSFYYEYLGLRELRSKREVLVQWQEEIAKVQPGVTDLWWLPAALAPYFVEHEFYYLANSASMQKWYTAARRAGVERFSYASTLRIDPSRMKGGEGLEVESTTEVLDLNVARLRLVAAEATAASSAPPPSFPLDAKDNAR